MVKGYNHSFRVGEKVESLSENLEGEVTDLNPFMVDRTATNPHMWISKKKERVSDHPFFKKF